MTQPELSPSEQFALAAAGVTANQREDGDVPPQFEDEQEPDE